MLKVNSFGSVHYGKPPESQTWKKVKTYKFNSIYNYGNGCCKITLSNNNKVTVKTIVNLL